MAESEFIKGLNKSVHKKIELFDNDMPRYCVRSILGGVYLTLSTIAGAYMADGLNALGMYGRAAFSFVFSFGLLYILFLGAELATSNMMFFGAGIYLKEIKWSKAIKILTVCILLNLVGGLIIGILMNQTVAMIHMKNDSHLFKVVGTKLAQTNTDTLFGGILGNIFVNIAAISFIVIKDVPSKFFIIISAISMFVLLGLEHLVANFGSFSLVMFSKYAGSLEGLSFMNIIRAWGLVTLGNIIGGGLLGLIYAWLNNTKINYKD